jgi:hypothetical protein
MIRFRACWTVHSPGWLHSDSEDADAPGGVLDHGQDIGLGAIEQFRGDEVARQDRLGLGTQELRPCRHSPPRRGVHPGRVQDFPYRRRCYFHSQAGQLAVDPAAAPAGVLAGQPEHQCLDVPAGGWPARPAALGPGGPAAADDVAVPAQDRIRGDQQPQRLAPRFRYHGEQGREQCPVRPVQARAARLPSLRDGELVAQEQDLGGLPGFLTPGQPQPGGQPRDQEEDEPQGT